MKRRYPERMLGRRVFAALAVALAGCRGAPTERAPVAAQPTSTSRTAAADDRFAAPPPAHRGDVAPPPSNGAPSPPPLGSSPLCDDAECGPAPLYPTESCADGRHIGGRGPCLRFADGHCGWSRLVCPASPPAAACDPSACSAPAAERWLCPDGVTEASLSCVRAKDGTCGLTHAPCRGAAQVPPAPTPPPPTPPPPKVSCTPLPSDAVLMSWPVGSICAPGGGPAPPPIRHVKTLQDGTEVVEVNGHCRRVRYRKCFTKCLPPDAPIATPQGEVALRDLRIGSALWTQDARGRRVVGRVLRVERRAVRGPHHVARVRFADGNAFTASLEHPLVGGGRVQDLIAGQRYLGEPVVDVSVVPYTHQHTWDLLPSGATGVYWVGGVALRSTLGP